MSKFRIAILPKRKAEQNFMPTHDNLHMIVLLWETGFSDNSRETWDRPGMEHVILHL